jgi:hypothetical protein
MAIPISFAFMLGCSSKEEPPPPAPVEIADISYLKEMDGDIPAHEGETIYIEGVATMGTGVMVSGDYLKFHIQDGTGGAYVWADIQPQAAVAALQAGGSSFEGIEIYEGDLVRIRGEISSYEGMTEFHPLSGGSISVRGSGGAQPEPHVFSSVDEIYETDYEYVGDLVRVNGVEIQGDASEVWPKYREVSKEKIELKTEEDANSLYMDLYPGSGTPGSNYPQGTFDIVGVLHRGETSYTIYPRALYDINPEAGAPLTGHAILVYKDGQDKEEEGIRVSVDDLPQCTYDTGREGDPGPEPIVTLASFIVSDVVTDPKNWEYQIVARDEQKPFGTLDFNQMKSGLLYEDEYEEQDVLNSHFYDEMELSQIFFLNDIAEIVIYPIGGGPQPGEATHGEGINLIINDTTYPVNFADLPNPDPAKGETETQRLLSRFAPDNIMSVYDMNRNFSYDQIRVLYDYRLIPYEEGDECFPVTWDEIDAETDAPMVDLSSGLPALTGITGCDDIDDLFTIEMVRKVIVKKDEGEEYTFYWQDLATVEVDGEEVVFFETLLDEPELELTGQDKVENDYYLWASDDFGTYFPYGHHHLVDMYFNPLTNEGFVSDEDMRDYGGRYSTKSILRVELRPIPQEAPSIFVDDALGTGWLSDPESQETCNGCHFKKGAVQLPVTCTDCHTMP